MKSAPAIAVSGIGCLSAAGLSLKACMQSIADGGSAPKPPTRFSCDHAVAYPVFEVSQQYFADGAVPDPDTMLTSDFALTAARAASTASR